ncbi:phenylacetic acid degradation protein PaaY [Allopusillimonas soli]|uniref:Phenylacetic acid degradation protein PaaY n=1 Tax=Allopusillimonas soli TaxID=659016 RepID=A0A853FD23_9BURK|nr:phenylacetic acid degradation protein PaaY [Allopusillimonas soli]NYT38705.1 phenylacetic acid degradation protein PaaY [Allopusillimonas soli]TEA71806.1 phenylacetic acid degradation protein PaaY [Allopusillimonas soli]
MVKVYALDGITPVVDPTAYVHPSAVLIGDVVIGPHAYIGPCACLRGDFGRIVVKEGANIQDNCVLHGQVESELVVDVDGHIGHGAILHSCYIGRDVLVGMNAVVMDNASVGDASIVGAMAFVKVGMQVPARSLVLGSPARVMRSLSDAEIAHKQFGTRQYQRLTLRSLASMRETEALTREEAGRPRLTRAMTKPD